MHPNAKEFRTYIPEPPVCFLAFWPFVADIHRKVRVLAALSWGPKFPISKCEHAKTAVLVVMHQELHITVQSALHP